MIEELRSHLHYDEQLAVEFYVLRHYRHLLTACGRVLRDTQVATCPWCGVARKA